MVDARSGWNFGVLCLKVLLQLWERLSLTFGCVPILFRTSSPKTPGAELFALSSIISLVGPEAGAVLHHLKIYAFTELFNAGTFLTHPTKRNFTTSGQGGDSYKNSKPFQRRFLRHEQIWPPITT
ncbi:hypothetical protein TNCV_1201381 [Trichonephila clavipes]|nr:hypothetical protein TNCV_1201381 [Trichonephila clavipes]